MLSIRIRPFPAALALVTVAWFSMAFAAAHAVRAEEIWIARSGVTTIHLNTALLQDLGVELSEVGDTVAAPPGTDLRMEDPHFSFALTADTDLTFRVAHRAVVPYGIVGGAIRHRGGFTLSAGTAVDPLRELAIAYIPATVQGPSGPHPSDELVLRGGGGDSPVFCDVRHSMFQFDADAHTLSLHYMNLSISESWAARMARPDLAGWAIGFIEAEIRAERISGIPGDEEAYVPDFEGTIDVGLGLLNGITQVAHEGSYPSGVAALSMATTACNLGDTDVPWHAPMEEDHPTIAMALYRLHANRLEQVGVSWMKHGFYALSNSDCTECQNQSDGTFLGVGCSDTYGVMNNADREYLGPRTEVNPFKGTWNCLGSHFAGGQPDCVRRHDEDGHGPLDHRLVARDEHLGTAGAEYLYEAYYLVPDDADKSNNIGSRRCTMFWTGNVWLFQTPSADNPLVPGPVVDRIGGDLRSEIQVGDGDGKAILVVRTEDLGSGRHHYEYELLNFDSDLRIRSFSIPLPAGLNPTNIGFHDPNLNPADDWQVFVENGAIRWETDTYQQDPNANALIFGTMFNFRFDADAPPAAQTATLGVFKPFGPGEVTGATLGPANPASAAAENGQPGTIRLLPVRPNPATGAVTIPFSIARAGRVTIDVIDASGRAVETILDADLEPGAREVPWDAAEGSRLPAGVYKIRMRAGLETAQRSLTLLGAASGGR